MAASSSCNPLGAAIDKLGRFVHQGASNGAEGSLHVSLLNVDCRKGIKATEDHSSISPVVPNKNQASRFASIAVAATAWAGLSMCPVEALAMAYVDDPRNVGESVFNTSTSMLQLSGYVKLSGDLDTMSKFSEENSMHVFNAEIEAAVPSVKPPNEGLNSPWVPKINKKDVMKRASMRCPKWTESELEMVLPDFQGRPKPFPRIQGRLYPFWPATASKNNNGDDGNYDSLIQSNQVMNQCLLSNRHPLGRMTVHMIQMIAKRCPPPLHPLNNIICPARNLAALPCSEEISFFSLVDGSICMKLSMLCT